MLCQGQLCRFPIDLDRSKSISIKGSAFESTAGPEACDFCKFHCAGCDFCDVQRIDLLSACLSLTVCDFL